MTKREWQERRESDAVESLVFVGDGRACLKRGGVWHLVTIRPLAEPPTPHPGPTPGLLFRVRTDLPGVPITVAHGGQLYAVRAPPDGQAGVAPLPGTDRRTPPRHLSALSHASNPG